MTPLDDDLDELLKEAEEAMDRGDIDQALDLLDEPAHAADADPEVRAMFGLALYYGGEYEDAYDYLREAVEKDPDDVECRGALGVCQFFRLEVVAAEKDLRRAVTTEPDWPEAHYWLGRVLEWRGRYPEAMIEFQRAQRLDGEHYPAPPRLTDQELDEVYQEALQQLPERIRAALDEVAILVEEYPDEELLREGDPPFPPDLLGLFTGASRGERGSTLSGAAVPTIHVFKRNLEHMAAHRDELVDELRVTLFHEVGHYLGLDEDDLHRLGLE
jgi:predicted Zn-dependent protease with MMP-like domain